METAVNTPSPPAPSPTKRPTITRIEPAWLFNALTILVQLGGSLLVILNVRTWLGAGALGVFTALATLMAHRFWTFDGIERVRELNTFLEHLAIIAGFVLVAILGVRGRDDRRISR